DAGRGDVVLQVDELLRRTCGGLLVRHLEQRQHGFLLERFGLRQAAADRFETGLRGGLNTGLEAAGEHVAEGEHTVDRTGIDALLHTIARARHEAEDVLAPLRATAQVRRQVHHRAVAAGADDQVAVDHFAAAGNTMGLHVDGADARTGHALAAARFDHRAAGKDAHATGACLLDPGATRVAARVGHGRHLQTGVEPVEHHAVGVVVVGRQHQLLARSHAVATHVGGNRTGQHVARHVVVGVHQRALVGAAGQYHAPGADAVRALTGLPQRRDLAEVIGQALVNGEEVVVVVTVDRGAQQQGDVAHALQLGHRLRCPLTGRLAVEGFAGVEQAAAELFLLVGENHPRAAAPGSQCGGQTGRAGADHQHVAVLVHLVVDVRIDLGGRTTQAGCLADVLRVGVPQVLRVHEGLVVEPGRHHAAADLAENAHQVGVDARPAVGAPGHQTGIQSLLGGTHVGHLGRLGAADLQDGVRLFGTGGDNAARTRVLEAATDDVDAIGQQGSGQAVAGIALVGLAVELEAQRLAAVDATALGKTIDLAHAETPL